MNADFNPTLHLDEDAMDELLMEAGSPAALAHLAACEPCTLRYAAFKSEFDSQMFVFNQATSAWSEARSNTIDRNLRAHKPTPRLTLSAICSSAVALLLVVGLGLNAGLRPAAPAFVEQASIAPAEQLDSDNAMLAAIDSAIVTPRPDRFGLYEPTSSAVPAQSRSSSTPQVIR